MTLIDVLHLAMLTDAGTADPGTDSPVNLVINDGTERLNHRFSDTNQDDQERGQANHYRLEVGSRGIDSALLRPGSIRVGVLGGDAWQPDILFLWGSARPGPLQSAAIVPLAIEMNIATELSSDDSVTVPSMPLRPVATGSATTLIRRLMLITVTGHDADAPLFGADIGDPGPSDHGTDNAIEIRVVAGDGIVVQHVIPDTPQNDLDTNQANLYVVPVTVPFTRASMAPDAIRLRITGNDAWGPNELYLFGLSGAGGRPESIVPLVHVTSWDLGTLSTDAGEGVSAVTLPLVPGSSGPAVGDMLATIRRRVRSMANRGG